MRSIGADMNHGFALRWSEGERRLLENASLDGEEMWTCTPGSVAEVPSDDELYDRKADPFQQNDVAAKNKGVTAELFDTFRDFMAELRTT
ncbi:MAG: hypothetical protein ACYC1C_12595 [Chloroflexota bacterium]